MAASDDYTPLFPIDHPVDGKVKNFISQFYAISDDRSRDEDWVKSFLPDATVIIGDKMAVGTENIRQMRKGMWEGVQTRKHKPLTVYPATFYPETAYNEGEKPVIQYMIEGTLVSIGEKLETREITWAARAILKEEQGELKYKLYQVYLHKKPDIHDG
ncbi:hypothetical protein F4815DRAFT_461574 [Daldinia loculata]|uniref:uncharacterized protein n=1 Tax=Daldinia loculata TaxID=103429 RepID=UPI0020C3875B|nr:uncharacterized protein F4817DRAFT_290897 [Daldinia loculata]KAI1642590.1 hypothetical protein F4817DRAFT_290897 [Daldinia loculata]KAI2783010.1 hypothetical protein F4815DRAFT_461574 [Daldinia loculata]